MAERNACLLNERMVGRKKFSQHMAHELGPNQPVQRDLGSQPVGRSGLSNDYNAPWAVALGFGHGMTIPWCMMAMW